MSDKIDRLKGMTESADKKMLAMLKRFEPEIQRALPRHLSADRMARIITTAIRANPKLAKCTPMSFFGSVIQASQLGLETNTPSGHAYLIPYGRECQLIIGYRGMIELAYRSKQIVKLIAREVRDGDEFAYSYGTDEYIHHVPSNDTDRDKKELTHVYAVARVRDGEHVFVVLTKSEVDARKQRSASAKSGSSPWHTDYVAMAKKTAIRAISAFIPQSPELARAEALDVSSELGKRQELDPGITKIFEGETAREIESQSEPVNEPPDDVDLPGGE